MGIGSITPPPVNKPVIEILEVEEGQENKRESLTLRACSVSPLPATNRSMIAAGLKELRSQKQASAMGKIAETGKKNARRIFHSTPSPSTPSPKLPKSSLKHTEQSVLASPKDNMGSDDAPQKSRKVRFELGPLERQSKLSQVSQDPITTPSPKDNTGSDEAPFPQKALDVKFESLGRQSKLSPVSQDPIITSSPKGNNTRTGDAPIPQKTRNVKFGIASLGRKSKPSQVSKDPNSTVAPDDVEGSIHAPSPRIESLFQPSPKRIGVETALVVAEAAAKKREARNVVNEDYWTQDD